MKRPQYVFRPNLNEPQHRRAWALLQQVPPAKRKEFLVQSILVAEQTDRLEKSIRKVVREELQAVNITGAVPSPLSENMEQLLDASRDSSFDCIVFPNYCNSHNSVVCSLSCGYNRFPLVEHDPRYTLIVRDILYWETARSLWTQYLKAIPGKEEKVKRAIRGILADYEKEERDIIYLESKNHCVLVHLDGIRQTPEGSPSFYATLDEAEHEFASSAFLRIHKSYLIRETPIASFGT